MPDHISSKLGAYLDGELDRRAQFEVQAHLETCPACRAELEELRRLSSLLRAAPQPEFPSTLDFKAQFMLQLPRRTETPPRSNGRMLLWLAPALVLLGWAFIQVALSLSTLVSLASQAGLLGGLASWINADSQQMLWVTAAQAALGGLLGPQGQTGLVVLNDAGLFTQNLVISLLLQLGAAVFYWGALALVWHYKAKALWNSPMEG